MTDIVVNVIKASNLADDDGPFNGSDPYVYITLKDCEPQRTTTVKGSDGDVEWNQELTFASVTSPATKTMNIRVYDEDWGRDDNIGECSVDLGKLVCTGDAQNFDLVVDAGIFKDARLQFTITTNGGWGNPEGGSGNLGVFVKSCTGLDDADFAGTTDPYVYLQIDGCEPQQTEKKEGTINPEWFQEVMFEGIENPLSKTLKITIYDDDTYSRDDKIGYCEVDLADLAIGEENKEYELGVDFALLGLVKTATLSFSLKPNGWGNFPG